MKTRCYFSILAFAFLCSCSDGGDDSPSTPELSDLKFIISFTIGNATATVDQASRTVTLDLLTTNLSSLTPTITISDGATVSPASGVAQDFTSPVTYTVTAEDGSSVTYQVTVSSSGIVSFSFNGTDYELIQQNETWSDAVAIAVQRGGFLAEINDEAEQNAIFMAINNASLVASETVAPDGGGASYIWLGGNDIQSEGNWVWNGNGDATTEPFWMGMQDGMPVDGSYTNWGNEPDNFGTGQDALGLAITDWPLGVAGQWNDIDETNTLFFLVELN